jgi:hypothetical protein
MVTSPSMQRRIIRDNTGVYHMVVESADQIWYSKSTDAGTSWSIEKRISDGDPCCINRMPCITVQHQPPLLLIVWEIYQDSDPDVYAVSFCTVDPATGDQSTPELIQESFSEGDYFPLQPVIASGITLDWQHYALVIWYVGIDSPRLMGKARRAEFPSTWFDATVLLAGELSEFSLAPVSERGAPWHLAWVENNESICHGMNERARRWSGSSRFWNPPSCLL